MYFFWSAKNLLKLHICCPKRPWTIVRQVPSFKFACVPKTLPAHHQRVVKYPDFVLQKSPITPFLATPTKLKGVCPNYMKLFWGQQIWSSRFFLVHFTLSGGKLNCFSDTIMTFTRSLHGSWGLSTRSIWEECRCIFLCFSSTRGKLNLYNCVHTKNPFIFF